MKTLYFEGAGLSDINIDKAFISNYRIRTAFHLNNGKAVYLEINGSERTKRSIPTIHKWQYTGFINTCHYITDDIPNDDCNNHIIIMINHTPTSELFFEYTETEILHLVNSLGANFDAIKVLPDLGGYRVFPGIRSSFGTNAYYYGDEFQYDPELITRREAVYRYYDVLEKSEERDGTFFSLWVDEYDPGALHLVRHFAGTFKTAHNTHWIIRVDTGDTLEDWIATAKETHLGKYGC